MALNDGLIQRAEAFLLQYLEGRMCHYEVTHPWRRDSKYVVLHSLRVHRLAQKIIACNLGQYTNDDRLMIELAALLHDIGKIHHREGHGEKSAEIVKTWLESQPDLFEQVPSVDLLLDMIATHSNKGQEEIHPLKAVLKDADALDEVGTMSIFMAANRIDHYSPWFFNQLLERIEKTEIPFCEVLLKNLHTKGGREILKKDIGFIKMFVEKLEGEIDGTHELYTSEGQEPEPFDFQVLCKGLKVK